MASKSFLRKSLCSAVGIVAALGAVDAGLATAHAAGTSTTATAGQVGEIVVTAQRRNELLQNVPITVNEVSSKDLVKMGISNVQDLKTAVSGLDVGNAVGFVIAHLRGVGSTTIAPGVENAVAMYVDGVYYASTMGSFLNFVSVKNVQVLKGPQGTLFGRNATGGLIQVTTKDPTHTLSLDANVTYGNYNTAKGSFYVADGLTSNLAADFALQLSAQGDGYGKNLVTGDDVNKNDGDIAARTKWVWTPGDSTKVTLALDYMQQRNSFNGDQIAKGAANAPFGAGTQANGQPNPILPVPPYRNVWDTAANINPTFKEQSGGFALTADQDLGFAHLINIAAYRQYAAQTHWDLYPGGAAPYFDGLLHTSENQFSEEMRLESAQGSRVTWTAGVYYFRYYSAYDPNHAEWGPPNETLIQIPIGGGNIAYITSVLSPDHQLAESVAGYGQATATILPNTNLTFGARYTYEKHTFEGQSTLYLAPGVPFAPTDYIPQTSQTFEKPTWRVALDHHFGGILAYVSYNTGFKAGGYNNGNPGDPPYKPETLTAYEIGLKGKYLDDRLALNIAGFHYDYTNIQVQKIEAGNTGIINGAKATIDGVDIDFDAMVMEHLRLSGSAEYLDAHFDSFPAAPISGPLASTDPVLPGSAAGNQLPYASHLSFSVFGDYYIPLQDGGLDFNVAVQYASRYYLEPDNVMAQSPYAKLNTSLRWQSASGRYGISLWGKNLTNAEVVSYGGTLTSGFRTESYDPPRTFGVTLSYHM